VATDDEETAAVEAAEMLDLPAGRVARWQSAATERTKSATSWAAGMREHNPVVDAGFLIYERDRVSAGSVLGSAIAFRLFLFFVPFLLFLRRTRRPGVGPRRRRLDQQCREHPRPAR
jgi:hypothetical protein